MNPLERFNTDSLRTMLETLELLAKRIARGDKYEKKKRNSYPEHGICDTFYDMCAFPFFNTRNVFNALFSTWPKTSVYSGYPVPTPDCCILTASSFYLDAANHHYLWWAPKEQPMYREYANSRRELLRHCIYQLRLELYRRKVK